MPAARARTREDLDLPPAPPLIDAWTGLLIVSLVATLLGVVFLWLDSSQYPSKPPDLQTIKAPARPPKTP